MRRFFRRYNRFFRSYSRGHAGDIYRRAKHD
jgi:hypothetical protein